MSCVRIGCRWVCFWSRRRTRVQFRIWTDGPGKQTRLSGLSGDRSRRKTCLNVRRFACQSQHFAGTRSTSQLARTPVSRTFNSRLMRGTIPPPIIPPVTSNTVPKTAFSFVISSNYSPFKFQKILLHPATMGV